MEAYVKDRYCERAVSLPTVTTSLMDLEDAVKLARRIVGRSHQRDARKSPG